MPSLSFDSLTNPGTGTSLEVVSHFDDWLGNYYGTIVQYRLKGATTWQTSGMFVGVNGAFDKYTITGLIYNGIYQVRLTLAQPGWDALRNQAYWQGWNFPRGITRVLELQAAPPQTTPITERIMLNLQAALAAISVAGGYNFDIQRCYRLKKIQGGTTFEYPCTQVFCESEAGEQDPKFYEHWADTMNITIIGALKTYDDIETELNKLEADIIQAIQADYTRGGLARWTKITGVQRFMAEAAEPEFGLSVSLEVKFVMPIGNPYKPV